MSDHKLKLRMVPEGQRDLLRLSDFLALLRLIAGGLEHLNYIVSQNKENELKFQISNLSHSSPYTVEMLVNNTKEETAQAVIKDYIDGINSIEKYNQIPNIFDYELVEQIKKLSRLKKKHFSEIHIANSQSSAEITDQLYSNIDVILGSDIVAFGSVRGMLESLNVHNNENKFYIYPPIGPKRIQCKFADNLFEKTKEGLKRYVKVTGKVYYKAISDFPYKVKADEIEIYPNEDELPTLSSLRGTEPNLTGDMSIEDFIRYIREEEQ